MARVGAWANMARTPSGWVRMGGSITTTAITPISNRRSTRTARSMWRMKGELLPHYNDSRGHAAGIMAPGGEILRSDDDGKTWKRVVAGFRNEYDFAFNADGELFTFDSDMEWDVGLPWYRPVRVNHCPIGAEFGWRNGIGQVAGLLL